MKILPYLWLLPVLALTPLSLPAQDKKTDAPAAKRDLDTVLVDSRLRRMVNELSITDEQKEKMRPIITDEVRQFRAFRENEALTEAERIKKADEVRAAAKPKVQAILSADQFSKYELMLKGKVKPKGK